MRESGILLPVSSLPGKYGIGCFSEEAYAFVDRLLKAGQHYWQILPLGPTGYGDSPYQSFSTYAGNPYFICLDDLVGEGLLEKEECEAADFGSDPRYVDYEKLYRNRFPLLRKACQRSDIARNPAFHAYLEENAWWLDDYALFRAVKDRMGGVSWDRWPEGIRLRQESAVKRCRQELADDIVFYEFLQFKFDEQWKRLKAYANERGIKIIGDIPIYVAFDSADTWANPELFQLDQNCRPTAVAGCPPDGFSADGQLWGNPLYRWDYHRETGYDWWMKRIAHAFSTFDVLRIDHFRGFDEYFSIPYGDTTAWNGHWEKGPGIDFFNTMKEKLGEREVIAEDLGYVTDSVRRLVRDSGFPGMKVLEFAFDSRDTGSAADYLPHNYPENAVAYTGTHDNETLTGWFSDILPKERHLLRNYLQDYRTPADQIYWQLICLIMRSNARLCIIPMQDYLGLDNSSRMNRPSTLGGINWRWRLLPQEFSDTLTDRIKNLVTTYGR